MRDWRDQRAARIRLLQKQTGTGLDAWNKRIRKLGFSDAAALCEWLTAQGVTGYPRSLLVMEHFGYPDFFQATGDELISAQYADRLALRPIFDAIVAAAHELGEVRMEARKTYVSLATPRRTFARVRPTTRTRVDLGLRLDGQMPKGRLQRSRMHETMQIQIGISSLDEWNSEALNWLRRAYRENR